MCPGMAAALSGGVVPSVVPVTTTAVSGVGGTGAANGSVSNPGGRSRVVHLRNIPGDMSDVELLHLCIPFGKVTNFLLLKGKNQVRLPLSVPFPTPTSRFCSRRSWSMRTSWERRSW